MFGIVHFPESKRILAMHLLAVPFLSFIYGVNVMVPVLLRKTLNAGEWQTFLATTAVPVMSVLAILWNEVYRRLSPGRYLLLLWVLAVLPLAGVALFSTPAPVLVFILLSASGVGAMQPVAADILRSCYPPVSRSRIFSILKAIELFVVMVAAYGIGWWLDRDPWAYRVYFPLSVVLIGFGLVLTYRVTRQPLFQERWRFQETRPLWASLRSAYRNMTQVLRDDSDFRRYEAAFCIYGLGWMITYSLLPFLVVDVLKFQYTEVAWSTQSVLQLTTLLMLVPGGYLMDRIGAIRMSGWSFIMLVVYPIGLLFAWDAYSLALVSFLYGIGMVGVNLAWTMGPVTLAKNAAHAPHYLAIHATLVAVRALLGQIPAVAFYRYTGMIYPPIAVAAVMFVLGGVLMLRLERDRHTRHAAEIPPASGLPVVRPQSA
jgi:MFS family permease